MLTLKKRYTLEEAQAIALSYGYKLFPTYMYNRSGYQLRVADGYKEPIGGASTGERRLVSLVEWIIENPAIRIEPEAQDALPEVVKSPVKEETYECLVKDKIVAVVAYDWANDGATQPWIVQVNDETVHTANTQNKAIGWVNWHYKNGTLPFVEPAPVETITKACDENQVVAHDSKTATDVWVVTTVDNKMIGVVGANSDGWWAMPSSSTTTIPLRHKSCNELISRLVIIESVLSKSEMAPVKKEVNMSLNINKATISKILTPWSSSRFNAYKKHEAVEVAIKILKGKYHLDEIEFQTGAFSERSICSGGRWRVDRVTQTIQELGERDSVIKTYDFSDSK